MFRDITWDNIIQRIPSFINWIRESKLFATLIFIISLFSFKNVWGFLVATIFMFGFIELSKVPFSATWSKV